MERKTTSIAKIAATAPPTAIPAKAPVDDVEGCIVLSPRPDACYSILSSQEDNGRNGGRYCAGVKAPAFNCDGSACC